MTSKEILRYAFGIRWFVCGLAGLFLFILLKFFVFDIVKVNSNDMSGTLHTGDVLLVKRSFINYNTNDIIYFQYPARDSGLFATMCLQRLIGLPGDTIEIKDKGVYINNFLISDSSSLKHNYYLMAKGLKLDTVFKIKHGLYEGGPISAEFDYSYALTKDQFNNLKIQPVIKSIELKTEPKGVFDLAVFPYSSQFKWNMDHFGKLYLPKKDDVLFLDSITIKLYSFIIRDHEKNKLEIKKDSILINDTLVQNYRVKQNYYFVLGDNRDNSNDSREFGYLPESYIKGKVISVLKRAN